MSVSRWSDFSLQGMAMGVLVAVVGFTSSFAIVLQGLRAAGASDTQAASGLMALSVAMGLSGIWLSQARRMPISVAWSTPGAALLIASGDSLPDFAHAVGAFIVCAVLLLVAGWFRPLGRVIESIPTSLANAMLAGILLVLCVAPVKALAFDAWLVAPALLAWWLMSLFARLYAVPVALLVMIAMVVWRLGLPEDAGTQLAAAVWPKLEFVMPVFDLQVIAGIAVPLFVVTMASQNIPGVAVLRANGYAPPSGGMIANTAVFSLLAAPFGSHAVNLAAITAAMCAGEDAHADVSRRYWAATVAGVCYVIIGLLAGAIVLLVSFIPTLLIEAIAGLALIGAFGAALLAAFSNPEEREAAAVTFLFSSSGLVFFDVSGAFWGLLCGMLMLSTKRHVQRKRPSGTP